MVFLVAEKISTANWKIVFSSIFPPLEKMKFFIIAQQRNQAFQTMIERFLETYIRAGGG